MEQGRKWNDFKKAYLQDDKYILILTPIMGKAGKIGEEGNERISCRRNCAKNEVSDIVLNCLTIVLKSIWEKIIESVTEWNWVLCAAGSKNDEGRVGSGCILYRGKMQVKVAIGKQATVWDREVTGIVEALVA